jgi:hypothetical protein
MVGAASSRVVGACADDRSGFPQRDASGFADSWAPVSRDDLVMSYAIVWNANNGADRRGVLDLAAREIELLEAGAENRVAVRYDDIESMFFERTAPATRPWEPSLVLVTESGDRIAIGSLAGLERLYELAELVAHRREQLAA